MCKGCRKETETHTFTIDQIKNYLNTMHNDTIEDKTLQIKKNSRGLLFLKKPNNNQK